MGSRLSFWPSESTGVTSTHSHPSSYCSNLNGHGRTYPRRHNTANLTTLDYRSGHNNSDQDQRNTRSSSLIMLDLISELERNGLPSDDFRQLLTNPRSLSSHRTNNSTNASRPDHSRTSQSFSEDWILTEALASSLGFSRSQISRVARRQRRRADSTILEPPNQPNDSSGTPRSTLHLEDIISVLTAIASRSRTLNESNVVDGQGKRCSYCGSVVPHDEYALHYILCATRPIIKYNKDKLTMDKGECAICLDDLKTGDTIARLPCLCIYHKRCIDEWFERKQCCPEHPGE